MSRRMRNQKMYSIARRAAKREIYLEDRRDHPLCWVDIQFTGGNVNTTPTTHSFTDTIRPLIDWSNFPRRQDNEGNYYHEGQLYIDSINYQLRFQQDVENIESSNTFRWCLFISENTWDESTAPFLEYVDLPPNGGIVKKVMKDKIHTLNVVSVGDFEGAITDSPGTKIYKSTHKIGKYFNISNGAEVPFNESEDVRWEAVSDTAGDGLQLFGYIRIYYRLFD